MIKPTIGRVVWVHRAEFLHRESVSDQPEPALVSYVWSDEIINVGGVDRNGQPFSATSVFLWNGEGAEPTGHSVWAEWMPYQKGQAAKTEALEKAATAGT
jgi:hypothetical protein